MEIKVTDQVEIKWLVRITVEIPDVSDELFGILHIAKPGDIGEFIRPYKNDTSVIRVNGVDVAMKRSQYEFFPMLRPIDGQPHDIITVLHMENLAHEPLFTGEPRLFDFRTIIPATEGDNLMQKWGVPYNCSDSKIEDDDTVTFVTAGVPFPIFVALSKMYPDREVRATIGERLMHNSMKPEETHLVFHDGKMGPYAPDHRNVFYDYPNGVQVESLVNILTGTIDDLSGYTVQCAETGFILEVDKENRTITIHPLCGSYTPNPFTAGESFVDADDDEYDEDEDDELVPDTNDAIGEPVNHGNEYQYVIEDDDEYDD